MISQLYVTFILFFRPWVTELHFSMPRVELRFDSTLLVKSLLSTRKAMERWF